MGNTLSHGRRICSDGLRKQSIRCFRRARHILSAGMPWAWIPGLRNWCCKKAHPEIFLEIALPFAGHNADEPACQAVQRQADLVHTVGRSGYRKAAFSERNRYMVDHSDFLISVYMESHPRSGTAKTMEYAKKQGLTLIKIYV